MSRNGASCLQGEVSPPYKYNKRDLNEGGAQDRTAEFIRNAEKLRSEFDLAQKKKPFNFANRRDGHEELEELHSRLQQERMAELKKFQQQLAKIHLGLKRFQQQLVNMKPSPDFLEKLKAVLYDVESSINAFKEEQQSSLEKLSSEERTCWQEICAFENKIETWSSAEVLVRKPSSACHAQVSLVKALEENLPPEVVEMEKFLQRTGGRTGGWDQYDHQSFLKAWNNQCGKAAYMKEAVLYLPGKSEQEIRLHEEWYLQLQLLHKKRKGAIARWKAKRQQEREARVKQQGGEQERPETRQGPELERQEKATRLQAWRVERQEREAQVAQRRLQEERRNRRRAEEERQRQLHVRQVVQAHVRGRREQEESRLQEHETRERAEREERERLAAWGIRRFQKRDLHKLEAKLQEKQAKEEDEAEKEQRLAKLKEKVEAQVSRDPARLWKPTKGWEERMKDVGPTGGGPVLHMFHRAVPTWRQGL